MSYQRYFFKCTINDFFDLREESWVGIMIESHQRLLTLEYNHSQELAWRDSFNILKDVFTKENISNQKFDIIFEYILPYESGRRPDVILLGKKEIFILEFKMKESLFQADVDQLIAYTRDISEYHVESRDKTIIPILILSKSQDHNYIVGSEENKYRIKVSSPNLLSNLIRFTDNSQEDTEKWIYSAYEPLPNIVEAAKMIMKK